ncbi:MAG: flagellar basal body rod protein FlgC [Acidimicrobiales bacterium]
MSDPFHSLAVSGSGMNVYQTWLDAIADNVANINNVSSTDEAAFQERFVVAKAKATGNRGAGAVVTHVEFGDPFGRQIYHPEHPLADGDGMVRMPSVDLSQQMTHMLVAQRAYQANVSAFRSAREAYQRALQIGNR